MLFLDEAEALTLGWRSDLQTQLWDCLLSSVGCSRDVSERRWWWWASGPVGHREEDYTNTVQILGPDKPPPLAAEPELVSETVSRQCRSEMVQWCFLSLILGVCTDPVSARPLTRPGSLCSTITAAGNSFSYISPDHSGWLFLTVLNLHVLLLLL